MAEYILQELKQDGIESKDELHNIILKTYETELKEGKKNIDHIFINHINPKVSELVIDLITREYALSKIHSKHRKTINEEDVLQTLIPKIVLELKWKMIKVYTEELRNNLKVAEENGNSDEVLEMLQQISQLQEVLKYLSKQQGERTII